MAQSLAAARLLPSGRAVSRLPGAQAPARVGQRAQVTVQLRRLRRSPGPIFSSLSIHSLFDLYSFSDTLLEIPFVCTVTLSDTGCYQWETSHKNKLLFFLRETVQNGPDSFHM